MDNSSPSQVDVEFVNRTKLIYQAGVDFESKPVVVFCAISLPKPTDVDYDQLLDTILLKLDEFVENDYTCIMFVGGNVNRPSWTWLLRAYRQLGRKYKKNLKNLYVVHPAMWIRLLMDMMNKIISPKFSRKVTWVKTLSELAGFVPLANMTIPEAVFEYNRKLEYEVVMSPPGAPGGRSSSTTDARIFGNSLNALMGENSEHDLPLVVTQCMEYVLEHGKEEEGIFRRSPLSAQLKEAKEKFDAAQPVNLDTYGVHVAAVLLKIFTRELYDPVFPLSLYSEIENIGELKTEDDIVSFIANAIIPQLSLPAQTFLKYICTSLHTIVDNVKYNKMTAHNLAVVWAPNLVRSGNPMLDVTLCAVSKGPTVGSVFALAIEFPERVFSQVPTKQKGNNGPPPPKPPRVLSA